MLNSDLCLLFDNGRDSVNCDDIFLGDNAFNSLGANSYETHVKNKVFNYCANSRGRGHFLNAKERMCCTWTRPDKMFDTDKWHTKNGKTNADLTIPLPALYTVNTSGYALTKEGGSINHCGVDITEYKQSSSGKMRGPCCEGLSESPFFEGGPQRDCDYIGNIEGPAWNWVLDFAYNEDT